MDHNVKTLVFPYSSATLGACLQVKASPLMQIKLKKSMKISLLHGGL